MTATFDSKLRQDEFVIAHLIKRALHEPLWAEYMLADKEYFDEGLRNLRAVVDEMLAERDKKRNESYARMKASNDE